MKKAVVYQGPLVGWSVMIFVLSSMPQVARVSMPYHLDKLAHAVFYGVLAWTAHRACFHQSWWEAGRRHAIVLAILFTAIYGLSDEFHQSFVPGRVSSWLDLAADVLGAIVATSWIAWRQRAGALHSASD